MTISKELLEILACPQCKGEVKLNEQGDGLICQAGFEIRHKERHGRNRGKRQAQPGKPVIDV